MKTSSPRLAPHVQIVIFLLLVLAVPYLVEASPNDSHSVAPAATKQKLAKVQIPFIANQGQSDKDVKFYARTFAGTVFVTETGELVYSLPKVEDKKQVAAVALKEELVGGKVTEVKGESPAVTKLSYFKGNDRSKWQSNIPSYDVVSLGEIHEGIEVKLKAYGNNVEKLFYVKPGAEPETIKIKISGGKEIRVNESGELEVDTEQGLVSFSKPVAFQEDGGKKQVVEVAYAVRDDEYGFKIGHYDPTKLLVIDPILAATFVGGSNLDGRVTLALDSTGNVYVAGDTLSSDFPGVDSGSADSTLAGAGEVFVAKLNSELSSILAATFLGGSDIEQVFALAVDSAGSVYVAGETFSADGQTFSADFPGVGPGSADSTFEGFGEAFIAKLNSDLSSILAASFLGGSGRDGVGALALDSVGDVYVAGGTNSSDFPGIGPITDGGFVAKLNSNLSSILVATFLDDRFLATMSLDGTGNVYVAGERGFVAKLNSDLTTILAETFVGGSPNDGVIALALDSVGNVYVGGSTKSPDFPGVGPGSADNTLGGLFEGFVAKLNSDLSAILAATFLGGSNHDSVSSLALDSTGNVYLGGYTESSDFPGISPGSADRSIQGGENFVVKLNSDLTTILAATFLGGSATEHDIGIAIDSMGNVYAAGSTNSADFPGIGPGSADSIIGSDDGFVAKLDANLSAGPFQQIVNDLVNFVVQSTSLNPTPVPGGPAGVFTITARLTNTSTENIHEPINAIVKTLTNGNKLLSATEGDGGVTSKQAIDAGSGNVLIPNESATVQFRIGLANRNRFSFFADVSGIVGGDD